MALNLRMCNFDLDHVKFSLEIHFFLSCLIDRFLHKLWGSIFIFFNNTHQKAAHLTFCLFYLREWVQWKVVKCNLGRDGAVHLFSQWITEALNPSVNYRGVCGAAPGFAQVCPKMIYIMLNEKKKYMFQTKRCFSIF